MADSPDNLEFLNVKREIDDTDENDCQESRRFIKHEVYIKEECFGEDNSTEPEHSVLDISIKKELLSADNEDEPVDCEPTPSNSNSSGQEFVHFQPNPNSALEKVLYYQCAHCEFVTRSKDLFIYHVQSHLKTGKVGCDTFISQYLDNVVFKYKEIYSDGEELKKLLDCPPDKSFESDLKKLLVRPPPEKPPEPPLVYTDAIFKCSFCTYAHHNKKYCDDHIKNCSKKMYTCSSCEFKTEFESALDMHMRIHTGENFRCSICKYETIIIETLRRHMLAHKDDIFKCRLCGFDINTRKGFDRHLRIHVRVVYRCVKCKFESFNKLEVNNHIHKDDFTKNLKCCFCDFNVVDVKNMKRHMMKHRLSK